jgi:hypothetical protein
VRKNRSPVEGALKSAPSAFWALIHEFIREPGIGAMTKKKAKKGKAAEKKTGKKKGGTKRRGKKEFNAGEVWKDISQMVMAESKPMTASVIGQGKMGMVAPYKFLLEMAGVFPQVEDGSQTSKEEDCLAKTLLDRLGIPDSPVVADEYAKEDMIVIPATLGQDKEEEDEEPEISEEKHTEEEVPAGA